ncbi:hypothetical protein [Streptomyces sp. NPDC005167]
MVVYPPDESGGRRVRVDGEILGMAHSVRDVAEFLRRAGLDDITEGDVILSGMIGWRGGGARDVACSFEPRPLHGVGVWAEGGRDGRWGEWGLAAEAE